MNVVYIGQYEEGSTSRMRGEYIRKILQPEVYSVVNISVPIEKTGNIFRSAGWRFYKGPLIQNVNNYCNKQLRQQNSIDLVWVDKGVFLKPGLIRQLKQKTKTLVHYTPDTAFLYNRSPLFFRALADYDYCITTKSFEVNAYKDRGSRQVLFCTQGYDPAVHRPMVTGKKKSGIAFAGLFEPYREEVVARLLEAELPVRLAGAGWEKFAHKHRLRKNLNYEGRGLFGERYAAFYARSLVGLGLLSKKFPELHTTRLFEIPACGTALATERNAETTNYFKEDEVLFYTDCKELTERLQFALANEPFLLQLSKLGSEKVREGGYDYESILRSLLKQVGVLS